MENTPPFSLTPRMLSLIESIGEVLGGLQEGQPLNVLPHLRKQNRIRSIHGSCAIEANSLGFQQVEDLINGKRVIGPKQDILEVKNAIEAYRRAPSFQPYRLQDLRKVHGILGKGVIPDAGSFRVGNEGVFDERGNAVFVAPPPRMVAPLMEGLFAWMKGASKSIHPLILSSVFHYEFVFIHPFPDGNGRTARLWQTIILGHWNPLFYDLPIENQIHRLQEGYYRAIATCHKNGNSDVLIEFLLTAILDALKELKASLGSELSRNPRSKRLLDAMESNRFYTAAELLSLLGLRSKETLRRHYLGPSIQDGTVSMEYPDAPTSRNQRYRKNV